MSEELDLLTITDETVAKLYGDRVEPLLRASEADRQTAMKSYRLRVALVVAGGLAVAGTIYAMGGQDEVLNALIFGGMAIAVGHWWAYKPLSAVGIAAKQRTLETIASAVGCQYQITGFAPDGLSEFKELSLLPHYDRGSWEDRFSGDHHGCVFAFCDGHLEQRVQTKNGSRWVTVFRGQTVSIRFPKKFQGTTVVRRDAGLFNFLQRWTTKLQRVGLSDSRLERAFEVYSDDQVEARYLIHPVFMERLLELETSFKGQKLRCAFIDGDLIIAVEGGDKFEIGTMFANLDDVNRARNVIADLRQVARLVDAVLTAEQSTLPT